MIEEPHTDLPYYDKYMPQHLLLQAGEASNVSAPVEQLVPRRWGAFAVLTVMLAGTFGIGTQLSLKAIAIDPQVLANDTNSMIAGHIQEDLDKELTRIKQLEDSRASGGEKVEADQALQESIASIQIDLEAGNYREARQELTQLSRDLTARQKQLNRLAAERKKIPPGPVAETVTAPILIYHNTPNDFEKQLIHLRDHGYETIDFDQLAAAFTTGTTLPPKPVIITFDDGFSNQMAAYNLLNKYKMKATFYIINGGSSSKYCIGAGRRYNQGYSCGDGYLSWDQVRELDQSELITIASHTLDHLALGSQSTEMQRQEIIVGKQQLEAELAHPVRHFAYPYGSFNSTTIAITKEAGFLTAVSTLPGTIHTRNDLYSLHRVRSAYKLP